MIGGSPSLAEHFAGSPALHGPGLHMAAHSHHPWPDVTREAHLRAWDVAAAMLDGKWEHVLGRVLPQAQHHVARRLAVPDHRAVAFAQNTHELLVRICSDLPRPMRVLTTDAEFHSARRQLARWVEAGQAQIQQVPAEPFDTFSDRFTAAMRPEHDLVLVSQVFYNSGFVVPDLPQIVAAVPDDRTYVVVDGYHAFMALPTDLARIAHRVFYLAGGYKYAMAGEGACFAVAPPGYAIRPVNTGWFAAFGALAQATGDDGLAYARDGARLAGSTFDPSGLFRFNAVQDWLEDLGVQVPQIHDHVRGLQEAFLQGLPATGALGRAQLLPPAGHQRGHFLTYRTTEAGRIAAALAGRGVLVDRRGDRLRFGFGIYHSGADTDRFIDELRRLI